MIFFRKLMIFLLVSTSTLSLLAQKCQIERNITEYDKLRAIVSALQPATINAADIAIVRQRVDQNIQQLDSCIAHTTDSTVAIMRYLQTEYRYQIAAVLAMKGMQTEALTAYQAIDAAANAIHAEQFPMEIRLPDSTDRTFYWSDFAPHQADLNMRLAELYFNQQQYDTAKGYIEKCITNEYLRTDQAAISYARLQHILSSTQQYDQDLLDAALFSLENYVNLNADERQLGGALLDTLPGSAAKNIRTVLTQKPELSMDGAVWAQASRLLLNDNRNAEAIEFATQAVTSGYDDREFLLAAAALVVQAKDREHGKIILDKLSYITPGTDCIGQQGLADNYDGIGETERAAVIRKNSANCDKTQYKNEKSAKRDNGLYLGGYVFPLFRRDWGVVAAIQAKKVLLEVSYQQLDNRRDKLRDLRLRGIDGARQQEIHWDGYYTHLAISKLGGIRGLRSYSGLLFGYNERNFHAFTVPVVVQQSSGSIVGTNILFAPVEQRYILMFNSGSHSYGRILASDFFFSFGGAYCKTVRGNATFEGKGFDFNNPFLDQRKSSRFVLMARFGVTVGLQVGSKTFARK